MPQTKSMKRLWLILILSLFILLEYAIVPPFLSVDITETPDIYKHVKELPPGSAIIEVPLRRINGNTFQGYTYYQIFHQKPLFNTYSDFGLSRVPENMRSFYHKMKDPQEVVKYENLVKLRRLGITHLVHHYFVGTKTVWFKSHPAPIFKEEKIPGLHCIYRGQRKFKESYRSPYDYSFADLYEITAELSPIQRRDF